MGCQRLLNFIVEGKSPFSGSRFNDSRATTKTINTAGLSYKKILSVCAYSGDSHVLLLGEFGH